MIIELAKFNTNTAFSNSDYINQIQPIQIDTGGSFAFKGGFLDYNTTSEQVIEIVEDVNVEIDAGFYYACGDPLKKELLVGDEDTIRPYELYVARDPSNNFSLTTSTRTFTIPKGNYSPYEITELVNLNLTEVVPSIHGDGSDFVNLGESNFFRPIPQNAYVCSLKNFNKSRRPFVPTDNIYFALNPPDLIDPNTGTPRFSVNDVVRFWDNIEGDIQKKVQVDRMNTRIDAINYDTGAITFFFGGDDNPDATNVSFTQFFMYKIGTVPSGGSPDDPNKTDLKQTRFYYQSNKKGETFDPSNNFTFPNLTQPHTGTPPVGNNDYVPANFKFMGASQIQLEFNNNNNALFQWTYVHTPYYYGNSTAEANDDAQEGIDFLFSGANSRFVYENTQTGIFFTSLSPPSFWFETLGFDPSIVIQDEPVKHILNSPLIAGVNITGNFIGYDALFEKGNNTSQWVPTSEDVYAVNSSSSQTFAIRAISSQSVGDSSFYIVDVNGLSLTNLSNDTDFFRTVVAIGSKEYNSQGIISLYPDGTSFYTNNGEPFVLSSIRTRILDSISKKPTETLGPKSAIYLEYTPPPPMATK
jgi:hypothetical protein